MTDDEINERLQAVLDAVEAVYELAGTLNTVIEEKLNVDEFERQIGVDDRHAMDVLKEARDLLPGP